MSPPSPSSRNRLLLAVPVVAYAAVIFSLSSVPGSQVPSAGIAGSDKLLHVAEYALLGLLLMLAVRPLGGKGAIVALAVGAAYAASDEAHQAFVPGRSADPLDFAVDVAALFLAVMIVLILQRARTAARRA